MTSFPVSFNRKGRVGEGCVEMEQVEKSGEELENEGKVGVVLEKTENKVGLVLCCFGTYSGGGAVLCWGELVPEPAFCHFYHTF